MIPDDDQLWQKLNAYIDGELAPAEAAEIAALVASDRRAAAVVATLARLKATTAQAGLTGAPAEILPRQRARPWRAALAAAVAALLVVGGLWVLPIGDTSDARMAALVERHAQWASEADGAALDSSSAARVLVGLGRLGGTAEIPDLTDAGLQLARISLFEATGTGGLHIGYVGTRGCRVSLIVEPQPAGETRPAGSMSAGVASWTVDGVLYTLLASGMHPPRFATIAASAEAATRSRAALGEKLREAMRVERDASPPCLG